MDKDLLDKVSSLIKKFEGFRPQAYQDQAGIWTVGWGLTGPQIKEGYVISVPQAEKLLEDRIGQIYTQLQNLVHIQLNNNQTAALISLIYNIGIGNFSRSTMLADLNSGAIGSAAAEFLRWNHVNGIVNTGLTRRRNDELALFKSTN